MFDNLLRGLGGTAAALVGAARGLAEGAVLAAIGYAIIYVGEYDLTVLGVDEAIGPIVIGVAVAGLRLLEGLADQIDPSK
jgi:hypothetical protein